MMIDTRNTAILILTCNDFEALEITLNQVLKTTPKDVKIYLLSNCKGLPGADVCEQINSIAAHAQYGRIVSINPGKCQPAYFGIRDAIRDHIKEEYIIKLDDDVFPVAENWFQELTACYEAHQGPSLAYVSGMVNNNPYGFAQLVQLPALKDSYAKAMPFLHQAGLFAPGYQKIRINKPGEADPGGWGTVWQFPQLARWIHNETTLQPDRYISLIRDLPDASFDVSVRYSINVMLFQREFWEKIAGSGSDDEEMINKYCYEHNMEVFISQKTPFVHMYFGPQRKFLLDMPSSIRKIYGPLNEIAGNELVQEWSRLKQDAIYRRRFPLPRKNVPLISLFLGTQCVISLVAIFLYYSKIYKKS